MQRIDKNSTLLVKVYKNHDYLGKVNCDLIYDIASVKAKVKREFQFNGTVEVEVYQEGGYFKAFRVMTGAK